jgi:peptidoglycan/xylan/chitin deacetylase (PgdA/CDA1 family)
VYRGSRERRSVALTFDDGPSPQSLELAEYLAEQEIPATFFQCGSNVLRHPEIAVALHEMGHELGNHTFSHSRLCPRLGWDLNLLSAEDIYMEFARAQEIIAEVTGAAPRLARAPYGLRWRGVGAAQEKLKLTGVMWTVIGQDWRLKAAEISQHVMRRVSPGGIICLHDGRDTRPNPDISETIAAVKLLVPWLKRQGYRCETVSSLLNLTTQRALLAKPQSLIA